MTHDIEGLADLSELLDGLRQGDFQARWDAAKQLEGWGEQSVPSLVHLLAEPDLDEELQWFIARILGSFPHPEGILALVELLEQSEDEAVSLAAAQGLARMGPVAIERLGPLLQEQRLQEPILRALVQIQHSDIVPLLLAAAATASPSLKALIFDALAPFQHPQILPLLLTGLVDPHGTVRRAAIANLGGRNLPVAEQVQRLIPFLGDPDIEVVAEAVRALGHLNTAESALALIQHCRQPGLDPRLQQGIIQALGWMGSQVAVRGLTDLWAPLSQQQPLPLAQMQAVLLSLGKVKAPDVQGQVTAFALSLLRSPVLQAQADLRARTLLLLGQVATPADLPALIDHLLDSDPQVRLHGIAALKKIHSEAAYQAIQARLQDDSYPPALRAGLAIALQEWE